MLVPSLLPTSAPEREHTGAIWRAMHVMREKITEFEAALDLFDYAEAQRKTVPSERVDSMKTDNRWRGWKRIAARHGAMVIYDFRHAFSGTMELINSFNAIADQIDKRMLKHANWLFRGRFPHWEAARNAAGHTGELCTTPAQAKANSIQGPKTTSAVVVEEGASLFVGLAIDGHKISMTGFEGDYVSYDLDAESVQRLWMILGAVYEALERKIDDQGPEKRAVARAKLLREFGRH